MARKSQAQRIQEAHALLAAYHSAGFTESEWAVKFLTSVISQMDRNRYPSKRQRDRIDAMVEEGIPTPKGDIELLAKIDAAAAYWTEANERLWERDVLTDMRRVVFNDWGMSDKQIKLLSDIIQRHQDDLTGANVFTPSDDQRADLISLVKLYRGYSGQWAAERPALRKAVDRVTSYLTGSGTIEEYHCIKLNKAMGSRLKQVKSPRFTAGNLAWTSIGHSESREIFLVTAITDVYVSDRGQIVNDWMLPSGSIETRPQDSVSKRRIR
jgi:hypothetical protein